MLAAYCPYSASVAWHCPWAAIPQPPVPASPAASLQQSMHNQAFGLMAELLALAHCLIGTNTEFQLPSPLQD